MKTKPKSCIVKLTGTGRRLYLHSLKGKGYLWCSCKRDALLGSLGTMKVTKAKLESDPEEYLNTFSIEGAKEKVIPNRIQSDVESEAARSHFSGGCSTYPGD